MFFFPVSSYTICFKTLLLLTCWFLPHLSEGFPVWKAGSRGCLCPVHHLSIFGISFLFWSPSWKPLHSSGKQKRSDSHPEDARAAALTPPNLVSNWVTVVAVREQRRKFRWRPKEMKKRNLKINTWHRFLGFIVLCVASLTVSPFILRAQTRDEFVSSYQPPLHELILLL